MLKVVFNKDGSIRQYQLPTYVVKGSSGSIDALRLEVAVNEVNLDDYIVQAHFKLPNGTTNSLYLGNTLSNLDIYGVDYPNGKYDYLTATQTYYEGIVEASIVITSSLDTNTVLYTFPFRITVNPSTYDPQNDDELITHAQYYNLLSYIDEIKSKQKFAGGILAITNIATSPYLPSYIYDGQPAGWDPSTFNPDSSHQFDGSFDGVPLTIYWDQAGECKPNAQLFAENDYDSGTGKCLAVYQNPLNLSKGFVLYKSANGKHTYMIYQNL